MPTENRKLSWISWLVGGLWLAALVIFILALVDAAQLNFVQVLGGTSFAAILVAVSIGVIALHFWLRQYFNVSRPLAFVAANLALIGIATLIAYAYQLMGFKDFIDVVESVVTIVAVLVGGGYYLFGVVFQKTYQRLHVDLTCERIDGSRTVLITCVLKNEADARIVVSKLAYKLEPMALDSERNELVASELPPVKGTFRRNLQMMDSDRRRWYWSVDAKSSARFEANEIVPSDIDFVRVTVSCRPDLTQESYRIQRTFVLKTAA